MEVLIIEDDKDLSELIKEIVEECGFQTVCFFTGTDANKYLKDHKPYLMILDYSLPDLNGKEFIIGLQNVEKPFPPFIVSTGQGDERIAVDMMKLGAKDYLIKNNQFLEILPEVIKRVSKEIENEDKLKRAEQELKESERKNKAWIENSPVCTKVVDLDLNLQFMSESGIRELKIDDITEYYGKPYPFHFYPESFKIKMKGNLEKAKETGKIITQEASVNDINGNKLWYHSTIVPVNDNKGNLDYLLVVSLDTTQQKEAEKAIIRSEIRLREAQTVAKLGSFEGSNKKKEVWWSDELYSLFGVSPDEFVPFDNFYELVHPDERDEYIEQVNNSFETGISFKREFRAKHKSLGWRYYETIGEVTYDDLGKIDGLRGTVQDITERKQTESALLENQTRIQNLIDSTDGIVWEADARTFKFTYVSNKAKNLLGYEIDDWYHENFWANHIYEDDKEYAIQYCLSCTKKLQDHDFEYRFIAKSGEIVWLQDIVTVVEENGEPRWIRGIMIDITERKRAQEALIESEERFRMVLQGSSIIVASFDTDLRYIWIHNPHPDFNASELLGKRDNEIADNEGTRRLTALKQRTIDTGLPQTAEIIFPLSTEEIIYSVNVQPVMDDDGKIIGAKSVSYDITERKRAEEELKESKKRILYAQQLAELGFWDWNIETGDLYWSDYTFIHYGYKPQEFTPTFEIFNKIIHPEDLSYVIEKVNNTINNNDEYSIKFRFIRPNGKVRYLYTKGEVTRNKEGHATRFLGSQIDITDTVLAEQELMKAKEKAEESEARYSFIAQNTMDSIWVMDENLRFTYLSPSTVDLFGYSIEEWETLDWNEFVHPKYMETVLDSFNKLKSEKDIKMNPVSVLVKHKNGTEMWVEFSANAVFDENNVFSSAVGITRDITERKKAEEALLASGMRLEETNQKLLDTIARLAESENSYSKLFNLSRDGYVINKGTGELLSPNPAYLEMLGYNSDEFNTINWQEITPKEWLDWELENQAPLLLERGYTDLYEKEYVRKDGKRIPVEVQAFLLKAAENLEDALIAAFVRDITERKKAEEALRESQNLLQKAENISNQGSWKWDIINDVWSFSENWLKIHGFENSGISRDELMKIAHPDDKSKIDIAFENALSDKKPYSIEHRIIRKDNGAVRDIKAAGEVHFLDNGNPDYMIGIAQDITDQKQAEEALRKSEAIKNTIVSNIGDVIVIIDQNGINKYKSPNVTKLFGWLPEELVDKSAWDNVHPDDLEASQKFLGAIAAEPNATGTTELRYKRKDGKYVWIEINVINLLNDKDIQGVLGNYRDVTERKESEELLARSSKLESIGTLAGGIAHDFNNLLSGIYGNIELARLKSSEDKVINHLNGTIDSLERATSLTNQLLTFSKGGEPNKKVEEVGNLIEKTVKFALSGSKVGYNIDISDQLYSCLIDKNQIMQVIDNLIINAKQAMPTGGTVSVSASNIALGDKKIFDLDPGKYVKIEIEDTGVGISEENLGRIFDPFFTTKPNGHGIGLSAVYSIIQKHDGGVDVESNLGEGTKFVIYLPVTDESKEEIKAEDAIDHSGKGTFIVMDDEESVREVVGEMLEAFGYDVILKNNGEEVLEYFKGELSAGREVAGMLFDLTIPGAMGGQETIGEIRKLCKKTKVFVASGYTDSAIMARPKEFGFNGTLKKPFGLKRFEDFLNTHMG